MSLLLSPSSLEFEAFDYSKLDITTFLPALKEAVSRANQELAEFKKGQDVSFDKVILPLEYSSELVDNISNIFFALYSAHGTNELRAMANEFSEILTNFSNDISLDPIIFERVKNLYEKREELRLKGEELQVVEVYYKSFARNGALLSPEQKEKMRSIDQELAKLSLQFSENVLNATNEFLLVVDQKEKLEGLPESALEAASELAKSKNHENKYAFSLQFPSFSPFMENVKNADLRKEMYLAYVGRATEGKFDNKDNILKTVQLRDERAKLLGYKTHAHFVLEERMASKPERVMDFLEELYRKAFPVAQKETEELSLFKKEIDGEGELWPWDVAYYANLLKKKKYSLDDEALRPYLKLENVIEGAFKVAEKLYGIKFVENKKIPVYHPEVSAYEVHDVVSGDYVGLFYADYFPRETKKSGAWMTDFRDQGLRKQGGDRPHISIVCNFTKPTGSRPSLLTIDEVTTLFHEFGHALHGLLSKCKYRKLSGTKVFWDFVELPSQIMENWVTEKACLDLFAHHYQTGESLPAEYVKKLKDLNNYRQGTMTMRQLRFAFLDMAWHLVDPNQVKNVDAFEESVVERCRLLKTDTFGTASCGFSHIFSGGYSAGYYSYKWAEVLDADAFEHFSEVGIFSQEVAKKFRTFILEKGGSEHPMELYKKFRGKEPSVDALLRRSGLL